MLAYASGSFFILFLSAFSQKAGKKSPLRESDPKISFGYASELWPLAMNNEWLIVNNNNYDSAPIRVSRIERNKNRSSITFATELRSQFYINIDLVYPFVTTTRLIVFPMCNRYTPAARLEISI